MGGNFGRFLKLEKPRDSDREQSPLASPGRFGPAAGQPDAAAPAQPQDAPAAGEPGPLDRFREPPPAPAPAPTDALPIDVESPDAQPFVRCALCEADSSRYAQRCSHCNAPLHTPEQRAFNDRLWAQRRDESARTEAELAELRKSAGAAPPDLSGLSEDQRRAYGELLAQQVAQRERARLAWMGGDEGEGRRETPGLRLLRLIPSTRLRLLVALCLLGVGLFFAWQFVTARTVGARLASTVFFWAMLALFVPGGRRRRRRFWLD